jgi:N-hydroxyarylamine O-acetyltransferase
VEHLDDVLNRLGFDHRPDADMEGLRDVYAAWCLSVPFDNLAKLIALRAPRGAPLPGMDAGEFFGRWLEHGIGGTCWTTSNALCELLLELGFDARRVAGSMGDTGYLGHASVKVRIGGDDWLTDSSMLTDVPLPLTDKLFTYEGPAFRAEVEAVSGTHIVWADLPPSSSLVPCRLLVDQATHATYCQRYEASRTRSPFNERLFATRNLDGQRLVLTANTRIVKTAAGVQTRSLSRSKVCESLRDEFGVSAAFLDRWIACGALDASFAPAMAPPPHSIPKDPPSRRVRDGLV